MTIKKAGNIYVVKTHDQVKVVGSLARATTFLGLKQ